MKYKAVLFDFDGVIAGTLPYHVQAWQKAFADYKIKILPDDIYYREGQIANSIAADIAIEKGLNLDEHELDAIVKNKRQIFNNITKAQVYPGTKKIVEQLHKMSVKIGIVTGSILFNVSVITGEKFLDKFGAIVTGDSVVNNKPHPEPFLTGAKKLGVKPEECVVIENAPLGIKAAKAAGMYCVAVKTTIKDEKYLQEADLIVEDMGKIPISKIFHEE
ncbi:HAD family phosphatase [candidate division KSB1 bacterium]|nr:HAD family phosphatase [candidate division KSB1 bacterium]MBL7093763.1 HAD family phosphatase [candidate division KSB1 bacterium]